MFNELHLTDIEICELALELEQEMNPYCGYQDPYGCGIGGFKKIDFEKGGIIKYDFLSTELFTHYDAHLVFTGVTRNSKNVLQDVTANIDKSLPLLQTVDKAYDALRQKDFPLFLNLLNQSWEQKKETSSLITENEQIQKIDQVLSESNDVLAHKLCGAGNGGFFLVFSKPNTLKISYESIRIEVESNGVVGHKL